MEQYANPPVKGVMDTWHHHNDAIEVYADLCHASPAALGVDKTVWAIVQCCVTCANVWC